MTELEVTELEVMLHFVLLLRDLKMILFSHRNPLNPSSPIAYTYNGLAYKIHSISQ